MKNRKLVITAACAFAAVAAPHYASADEDGVDCSKQPSVAIKQSAIDFLAIDRNAEAVGCTGINVAFVEMVGKPTPANCLGNEEYCRDGKHYIQKFTARDDTGAKMEGHIAVDWHFTRAGFTEYCRDTVLDCKAN